MDMGSRLFLILIAFCQDKSRSAAFFVGDGNIQYSTTTENDSNTDIDSGGSGGIAALVVIILLIAGFVLVCRIVKGSFQGWFNRTGGIIPNSFAQNNPGVPLQVHNLQTQISQTQVPGPGQYNYSTPLHQVEFPGHHMYMFQTSHNQAGYTCPPSYSATINEPEHLKNQNSSINRAKVELSCRNDTVKISSLDQSPKEKEDQNNHEGIKSQIRLVKNSDQPKTSSQRDRGNVHHQHDVVTEKSIGEIPGKHKYSTQQNHDEQVKKNDGEISGQHVYQKQISDGEIPGRCK